MCLVQIVLRLPYRQKWWSHASKEQGSDTIFPLNKARQVKEYYKRSRQNTHNQNKRQKRGFAEHCLTRFYRIRDFQAVIKLLWYSSNRSCWNKTKFQCYLITIFPLVHTSRVPSFYYVTRQLGLVPGLCKDGATMSRFYSRCLRDFSSILRPFRTITARNLSVDRSPLYSQRQKLTLRWETLSYRHYAQDGSLVKKTKSRFPDELWVILLVGKFAYCF